MRGVYNSSWGEGPVTPAPPITPEERAEAILEQAQRQSKPPTKIEWDREAILLPGSALSVSEDPTEGVPVEDEVLETAQAIINGARQADYGTPERSFDRIASLWTIYLNNSGAGGPGAVDLNAHDVGMMMILLKVARSMHNPHKLDNYTDMAGYAALTAGVSDVRRD